MNATTEECITVCNSLLRGELSAVETYDQALEKYAATPAAGELGRIRSQHSTAAARLAANVREMGGVPETGSGVWGTFATTVQGTANLFGEGSALQSLKQGEEKGRRDYEDALENDEVMEDCKMMIRTELLPPIHSHISILETLGQHS